MSSEVSCDILASQVPQTHLNVEAETRLAFLASLTADVINPLMTLKVSLLVHQRIFWLMAIQETQERIRKRIRDDLKEAITAHTEYEEGAFPKLKRTYMKKSQDVEVYFLINAYLVQLTHPLPQELRTAATTLAHSPAVNNDGPSAVPKAASSFQSVRPTVTAPQPLKPLERRVSQSVQASRARSPSTSTALSDLAHQGTVNLFVFCCRLN